MTQDERGQGAAQQNGQAVDTVSLERWSAQMYESLRRLRMALAEADG